MNFAFFLLLNAVLFIRPEELFPDGPGLHLYLVVMCLCLLASGGRILALLQPDELKKQPITVCVIGVWAAGILSQLVRGDVSAALDFGIEFGKIVLYYLLLIVVIDSTSRLRSLLGWLAVFTTVLTVLALLQFHGAIDLDALRPVERSDRLDSDGQKLVVLQLRSTGIFNDPNDLCMILVTGSICALYRMYIASDLLGRLLWGLQIGLFAYALTLTQSRGGLLGMLAAILGWLYAQYGWKALVPAVIALAPAAVVLGGDRQTDISLSRSDTGIGRVMTWSEGFVALTYNPVTGVGVGRYSEVADGLVAHNTFVHAFVETGLIGGSCFVGALYIGLVGLYRGSAEARPSLAKIRSFVIAMVIGYVGGNLTISRNYVIPTYLIIGVAASWLRLTWPSPPVWLRFDRAMLVRLLCVGLFVLVFLRVVTMVLLFVTAPGR